MNRLALLNVTVLGAALAWCAACNPPAPSPAEPASATPSKETVRQVEAPQLAALPVSTAAAATAKIAATTLLPASPVKIAASSIEVRRLVVTTAVKDREPLRGEAPFLADGSPIYAFAELANSLGESENVRITFERKGGTERVGNVTLPVPGQVGRHRTWAMTRFIREAGVWDAVLWSETGVELGRTSFEVAAS